ncbi:hypothetical protein pb186bvf_016537 [Paramecium bursaria]
MQIILISLSIRFIEQFVSQIHEEKQKITKYHKFMFNQKRSNMLFQRMPKQIRDESITFRTQRSNRKESLEQEFRILRKKSGAVTERIHYETSPEQLVEDHKEIAITKRGIERREQEIVQSLKNEIRDQSQKLEHKLRQLEKRSTEVDEVLSKLLNTKQIIDQKPPMNVKQLRMFKSQYRTNSEIPLHLKNTVFDPKKYKNLYESLFKGWNYTYQMKATLGQFKKFTDRKHARTPNFVQQQ